jgi:hypothetical protein
METAGKDVGSNHFHSKTQEKLWVHHSFLCVDFLCVELVTLKIKSSLA